MKRRILLALGALLLTTVSFVVGRTHPAHHYQQLGQSKFLYDQATGRVCLPLKEAGPTALDAVRSQLGQPSPSTVPQCGTE